MVKESAVLPNNYIHQVYLTITSLEQWFVYSYLFYFFFVQLHPVLMLIGLIIIGGEGILSILYINCIIATLGKLHFEISSRFYFVNSHIISFWPLNKNCSHYKLQSTYFEKRSEEIDTPCSPCYCTYTGHYWHLCCFQIS